MALDDILIPVHMPYAGLDVSQAFGRQAILPVGEEKRYSRTCARAMNVRAYDGQQNKLRGGSRTGLAKYLPENLGDFVQGLDAITAVNVPTTGDGMQTSQSARLVTLVAVSQGNIKIANPGDTSWRVPTNGMAALNVTGVVFSATNSGALYFADGTHWKLYRPSNNTVEAWVATAGVLPVDSDGNAPRLICTWRGRTVLSGLLLDPQNWFMSAVDGPGDFDYSPLSITPTQAVAGNNSTLGLVGDVITCLIPASDDVLFFGGDHAIWKMVGDPMDGGRLNNVSEGIGMAWGAPWCKEPGGKDVFFFSNQCGIYVMNADNAPQRISQRIDNLLKTVNTGSNTIRMVWDDRFQGFHVFVTKTGEPYRAVHAFYEARSGAWWTDSFVNKDHNPLCCCTFDGNTPQDRVALIGSWDGYVRFLNPDATDDDGYPIMSSVVVGPFLTKYADEGMLKSMNGILGETSGEVTYEVFVGATAEMALNSEAVESGIWEAGRNLNSPVRKSGHAVYVRLSATNPWALEEIVLSMQTSLGLVRQRGA